MHQTNLTFTDSNPPHVEITGRHRVVLDHHLRPGEKVLYAARPAPWSTYFDGGLGGFLGIVLSLGAVLVGGGGIVICTLMIVLKGAEPVALVGLIGFAGFAIFGAGWQFELLSASHSSVHTVTDHRLVTIRAWQPKFVSSTEISNILCLRRTVHWGGGKGTLTFGTGYTQHKDDDDSSYWYMNTATWYGVPYASVAHDLIKLRRLASGAPEIRQMPLWALFGNRTTTPPPA